MKIYPKINWPFIAAFLVVAVWAETFVTSKFLLNKGLTPADIFFYRFTLAYLLIWFISPKRFFCSSWRDELTMLLLGITGGSLYFLSENSALKFSTASNVAIIVCSAPLLTALLLSLVYKEERMSVRQAIGSVVAFIGVSLVILNGEMILHLNPLGDMLALCAAATWAVYSLLIKRVSDRYDTRFVTRKVFGYGLLTIIPYFFFVRPLNTDLSVLGQPLVWGNLAYLGLVASLVCFVVWNWALVKVGTVRTTNLIYCQPVFTMVIAAFVLKDRITWMAILGTLLLIFGMMWALAPKVKAQAGS